MSFECRVRPFSPPSKAGKPEERPDLRKPPILFVNRASFEALERAYGTPGGVVHVRVERLQDGDDAPAGALPRGEGGAAPPRTVTPLVRQATVMASAQEMKADVVKVTRVFMEAVGFHTGDLVRITAGKAVAADKGADKVVVEDVTKQGPSEPILYVLQSWERTFWELGIREFLRRFLFPLLISPPFYFLSSSCRSLYDSLFLQACWHPDTVHSLTFLSLWGDMAHQ